MWYELENVLKMLRPFHTAFMFLIIDDSSEILVSFFIGKLLVILKMKALQVFLCYVSDKCFT